MIKLPLTEKAGKFKDLFVRDADEIVVNDMYIIECCCKNR